MELWRRRDFAELPLWPGTASRGLPTVFAGGIAVHGAPLAIVASGRAGINRTASGKQLDLIFNDKYAIPICLNLKPYEHATARQCIHQAKLASPQLPFLFEKNHPTIALKRAVFKTTKSA